MRPLLPGAAVTAMDGDRMDSLEGWVAVRPNLFQEPERYKMSFIVAWNRVDCSFAVTCHNRSAQQRKRREGEDGEQSSWAGLYSVQDLEHVHRQLSSVCSRLEPFFPRFPAQHPAGSLWTLLFPNAPSWEGSPGELEAVCRALEGYLGTAMEECGRRIVLDVLFPEDGEDVEEYYENLHEVRKKSLEERVCRAKERLRTILYQHKKADKMMSLLKVYEEEDEAFMDLVTMATQFHLYLLQPFRDMRELAILYKLEILKSLEIDDLGPKRVEALQKEADKWNTTAQEAERSIQNVTVNYFKETSKALAAIQKHMELDGKRFGQATWASAMPRLERVRSMLAKESLQHMRSMELCLNQKRADIKQSMESLSNCDGSIYCLDRLEMQYYETQLELYDVQFEILKHEEMLLITELNTLRRQMKEKEEEVVYYDTCEDPQELQTSESNNNHSSSYSMLRRKAQQLESKRGNICSRRALLRNKKDQCIETQGLKLQQYQETQRQLQQHHSVQMKRDQKKEDAKKKKEWVDQERQKTLQRLKSFKDKKESHVVLKTSRIQSRLPSKSSENLKPSEKAKGRRSGSTDFPVQKENSDCRLSSDDPSKQNHFPPPPVAPPPPPPPPLAAPPPPPPLPPWSSVLESPAHLPHSAETRKLHEQQMLIGEDAGNQTTPGKLKAQLNQHSGSMEEVLASLKRSETLLRRVEPPQVSITSARDNILMAIRQGVKLKKVHKDPVNKEPENDLERSIKAAMLRMKKVSADSDDEEKSECISADWDN